MTAWIKLLQRFTVSWLLLAASTSWAATYTVTSTSCAGPGSIVDAFQLANANAGADVIEFTPGLDIRVTDIGCIVSTNDPSTFYIATVTEDLTINGNGALLNGDPLWTQPDGRTNVRGQCPSDSTRNTVVRQAPGFVRVDPGIDVTINDIRFQNLSALLVAGDGATVSLNEVSAVDINDWFSNCDRSPITISGSSATIEIADSELGPARNSATPFGQDNDVLTWPGAIILGAGNLSVDNTMFTTSSGAVQWGSGIANIQSSRLNEAGGINLISGTANIVNTAIVGTDSNFDRLRASANATMNVTASTMAVTLNDCPPGCVGGFGVVQAVTGATINLSQSAIGYSITSGSGGQVIREATGGNVVADALTWIQPIDTQTVADLRTISNQPNLLTDAPGLPTGQFVTRVYPFLVTPLLGTTAMPGVLIDVIPDAAPGGANALISPIDGSILTLDALGNSRVDGNGRRTIGAVQLGLAPTLILTATGDALVDLNWTRPLDPSSGTITGYDLCYGSGPLPDPTLSTCVGRTQIAVSGPDTLSTQVTGLTNGTTYWFQVRGVNPAAGPWSNQVTAVPAGVPDAPVVSAIPGTGSAELSWTTPNENGSALTNYIVQYRPAGTTPWQVTSFNGLGTSFTVGGLTDLTSYEFSVTATNGIGSSNRGLVTATPRPAPYVAYANVTGFENFALTILPTFANVYGTPAYSLFSGSLPPGMTLSATTGEITGTPTTANSYPLTIQLVDSSFPTPVQSAFTVTIQPNASATLTANYDNYAGPAGSPLGSPLRPNVTGSTGTLSFTLAGGDPLPSGLVLNATTGEITGTPDTATGRVFSLNMEITDAGGTINEPFNIEITPALFYPASQGIVGDALSINPSTSLAVTAGTYQVATGQTLPAGLNLDSATGSITGIPEARGLSTVTIEYTTNFQSASAQVPITIDPYTINLSYPPIAGVIGQAVTIQPSVTGLKGTATYSINSGSLPAGLSLNPATGVISGTPTGSPTSGVVVIGVADTYEFGSSQVVTGVTAPTPGPIPTLQSWALIALTLLMAGIGLRQARRKRAILTL